MKEGCQETASVHADSSSNIQVFAKSRSRTTLGCSKDILARAQCNGSCHPNSVAPESANTKIEIQSDWVNLFYLCTAGFEETQCRKEKKYKMETSKKKQHCEQLRIKPEYWTFEKEFLWNRFEYFGYFWVKKKGKIFRVRVLKMLPLMRFRCLRFSLLHFVYRSIYSLKDTLQLSDFCFSSIAWGTIDKIWAVHQSIHFFFSKHYKEEICRWK